jgi:hypothetical protein
MRGLSLLIRMAQHDLEERRSDLGCISRARSETGTAISELDEAVASESDIAMSDPVGMATFSVWARQSAQGRARLRDRFDELDMSAHAARESLRETVAHMRRLELALETVQAKARRLSGRQADARADERELTRRAEIEHAA